jgi:hypothetical protein
MVGFRGFRTFRDFFSLFWSAWAVLPKLITPILFAVSLGLGLIFDFPPKNSFILMVSLSSEIGRAARPARLAFAEILHANYLACSFWRRYRGFPSIFPLPFLNLRWQIQSWHAQPEP